MHATSSPPLSERIVDTVSFAEQERRWAAVRQAMNRDGIDVLLFHNLTESLPGYVRWIADEWHGGGYPVSVVFPRDDYMSVVSHGPMGATTELDPHTSPIRRGVKRVLHAASFVSAHYSRHYDAERIVEALREYPHARVGLVGPGHFPFPLIDHLRSELPTASFENYSDEIDVLKADKSDEEIEQIRRAAKMQDDIFAELLTHIRPGMKDRDLSAFLADRSFRAGGENGVLMFGSGPEGDAAPFAPARFQNRTIRPGDSLTMLFERSGPTGYFTEIGRTLTLGPAPQQMLDEHEFVRRAQDYAASLLVPGAPASEIAGEYNLFLTQNGRPEEFRLHCHGQGYDIVERPLARKDETLPLGTRMNLAVHPQYSMGGRAYWLCDNWIINPDGTTSRLHTTERKIFEIDI